jgi:DNA-binding transcriptional MerR regulator
VGPDDKHIATVDADGVALAAIQGLNQKLETGSQKSEARIQKLEADNAQLKHELHELKELLMKLSAGN